eukprot:3107844-Alexandrium_andersonii.AAC.1
MPTRTSATAGTAARIGLAGCAAAVLAQPVPAFTQDLDEDMDGIAATPRHGASTPATAGATRNLSLIHI